MKVHSSARALARVMQNIYSYFVNFKKIPLCLIRIFNRNTLPAKTSQILSPFMTANFKINQSQQCKSVSKRPGPIASLALKSTQSCDFLPQQGVPVAIWCERFNAKTGLHQMVFIPILGESAAILIRWHVDVGSGQNQNATGFG